MSMTVSMGSFIVSHPFRPEHYPVVYFITPENEVLTYILPPCATEQEAGDAAHAAFDLIREHEDWGPHNMPPRADLDDETYAQITRSGLAKTEHRGPGRPRACSRSESRMREIRTSGS